MTENAPPNKGLDVAFDRVAALTLGVVASIVLFAMMVLAFVDVWGRYILRKPVFGGYEITEFLMGVLIFTALPLLCTREGHVTLDILDHFASKGFARWQRFFVNVVSAAVLAVVSWRLFELAPQLAANNEVTMTLKIPHSPFAFAFAILAAIAALACVANAVAYLLGTRKPDSQLS